MIVFFLSFTEPDRYLSKEIFCQITSIIFWLFWFHNIFVQSVIEIAFLQSRNLSRHIFCQIPSMMFGLYCTDNTDRNMYYCRVSHSKVILSHSELSILSPFISGIYPKRLFRRFWGSISNEISSRTSRQNWKRTIWIHSENDEQYVCRGWKG